MMGLEVPRENTGVPERKGRQRRAVRVAGAKPIRSTALLCAAATKRLRT
jgi:hypothetical protein